MKILLFGKNGQLGFELQRSVAGLGEVIALDRNSQNFCGNLSNLQGIAASIREANPDIIINAAAYTAVDKAEDEHDLVNLINAQAPGVMAEGAKKVGALLVHYSTDYVFDGSGDRPWKETDTPAPLNIYGASKLAGEKAIQSSGCRHYIFRTSWVFGAHGNNFIKTILRLAQEREILRIVNDQIGAPTSATFLADATGQILRHRPEANDLYHLAAHGEVSWYDYTRFILERAQAKGIDLKCAPENVTPIPSTAYPTPALRPLNSRLNTSKAEQVFGLEIPKWQKDVEKILSTT